MMYDSRRLAALINGFVSNRRQATLTRLRYKASKQCSFFFHFCRNLLKFSKKKKRYSGPLYVAHEGNADACQLLTVCGGAPSALLAVFDSAVAHVIVRHANNDRYRV